MSGTPEFAGAPRRPFAGAVVHLSRSLIAPEQYDALRDVLASGGAEVRLCADPSQNGPLHFHAISSRIHEKFDELKAKGCNLIGPQCILSCAQENRPLPKQGYTCCLGMDGVKVLASGFENDEKSKIEEHVSAMGGVLLTRSSMEADFVIAKNVLSSKYKWALDVLKKPIVNLSWLDQCWIEHRLVPQEPYRILPFTGLNICISRIPYDERREMAMKIVQNGGQYSADLTKKCTHLVSNAPGGDKYVVARRWGNIHIVNCSWVDQSIARRACLDEGFYPVNENPSSKRGRFSQKELLQQQNSSGSLKPTCTTSVEDLVSTMSQNVASSFCDAVSNECEVSDTLTVDAPAVLKIGEQKVDPCVAEDSAGEDNDLYLSNCRISLVGFAKEELPKLVTMIRNGGGSRYVMLSDKLTHIVVGAPSEVEKKEVRHLAMKGVIDVVKSTWLEECSKTKTEIAVLPKHIAFDLLYSKDNVFSASISLHEREAEKRSGNICRISYVNEPHDGDISMSSLERKRAREMPSTVSNITGSSGLLSGPSNQQREKCVDNDMTKLSVPGLTDCQVKKASKIFKGRKFWFSSTFPHNRRTEVIEWVHKGGGTFLDDQKAKSADYIVECHGCCSSAYDACSSAVVSTHWIRSCLEDGVLQDVGSHVIYTPLHCRVPLPGYEGFCFCISQYKSKDRVLLKNLCIILGAKFTENLTRKVTHMLCKFTSGAKYEASCKRGIELVTAEWIFACISLDRVVATDSFRPKEVPSEDKEFNQCSVSQFVTLPTQLPSQTQVPSIIQDDTQGDMNSVAVDPMIIPKDSWEKSRLLDKDVDDTVGRESIDDGLGKSSSVPDVADAIEDLLAQTSRIPNMQSPRRPVSGGSIFTTDRSIVGQDLEHCKPSFGITKHWLNQSNKRDTTPETTSHSRSPCNYDAFSETQTESQVVGYEEDLTGRQKIIDRVRSQSMSMAPSNQLS